MITGGRGTGLMLLNFDIQMEVWIQRNLGLRPGSLWILGPHDDQIPEMRTSMRQEGIE